MSDNKVDEFDDLDDYLEDPRKLDEQEKQETVPNEAVTKGEPAAQSDDPEVVEMMEDLQKQFQQLMQQEGGETDQEMVQNFETLLTVLGDASKEKDHNSVKHVQEQLKSGTGFKNIISNTLDRLKENSTKVDETLEEEKKNQNSDDILSQLLDQLVENGDGNGADGEGMDNAILKMLSQMSSKEVLYQPMKQMQGEFTEWMGLHEEDPEQSDKIDNYKKQYALVNQIIGVFESDDYTNEKYHAEIADLLDELEQLGDSPVAKGTSNDPGNDMSELAKMLEIQGDENLGNIDKDLEDTCKQQ
ncbi:Pex19 [Kluyveromyces lactis]|nr:Pex19 [Kluyveromyces lactis]